MKKTKQTNLAEFIKLPKLNKDQYRLLWRDNYWDGPVSGMLLHKKEMLYFMLYKDGKYNEDQTEWIPRQFTVHRLQPEVLQNQTHWHMLFQKIVGLHCDYNEDGHVQHDFSAKSNPNWQSFYEKKKREYDPNEPDLDDPKIAKLVARIEMP